MNSGDTDPTFIETNIPWVARCIGDDRQMNYLLADYLYRKLGFKRAAIIRASNRYGRFGVREIIDASRRLEHPDRRRDGLQGRAGRLLARAGADQGRQRRRRDPLGRRRRGGQDPQPDARDGHEPAVLRLRPLRLRRVRQDRRQERRGGRLRLPLEPDPEGPALPRRSAGGSASGSTRSRRPTPPTPSTA